MAAPSLRIVRQSKGRRALVAASQPIADTPNAFRSTMAGTSRGDWQSEAWDMLDIVGELRYYVSWRSASSSRVRIIASELDPETGLPTGECSNTRVNEIVKAIAGGPLGQGQLLKRGTECLTVPGEFWLAIILTEAGVEQWLVLTGDEIKRRAQTVEISLPDGSKHEVDPAADTVIRVWNARPRKASEADSPVRASLDSLREIVRTTKTISNASKSRLIGNGVVFVPQEMSLPPVSALGGETPEGTPAVQQLQELLWQVANTAYDDEDSMAALIPMFATVPGEQVKNVSHLKFDNSVTDIAIKTRNDAIARLAMGLDVSPERLLGLGSSSNHWSAWAIGDDDVRLHIVPPVEVICSALTEQVLLPMLEAEGIPNPDSYVLWHDESGLTADPDMSTSATNAFDRGTITAEAYREFLGLGDTGYDLSTLAGWQTWAKDRVSAKPELLPQLMPLFTELDGVVEVTAAPPPNPNAQPAIERNPQQEPQTGDTPPPQAAVITSRESLSAQSAVVEVMVTRALELAGKRRRTRADYERLREVPMHETHRYMGPVDTGEVANLIRGWDSALEEDVLDRLGVNSHELRAMVARRVAEELTRPVVDA